MTAVGYQQIPVTADLQDPSAREESVNSIKSLLQGLLNSITSHFVSNLCQEFGCSDLDVFGESKGYSGILTSPRSTRYRSEPSLVGERNSSWQILHVIESSSHEHDKLVQYLTLKSQQPYHRNIGTSQNLKRPPWSPSYLFT